MIRLPDQPAIDVAHFVASPAAMADTDPYLIYTAAGRLLFDLDGIGPEAALAIAALHGAPTLTLDNFAFG